jgi:hypothetical protein
MSDERAAQGQESADRGELAERTFIDMLRWWLSRTGAPTPSQLFPDSQKVDIKVTIPSLWSGVENIETNWQIKSTARRPQDVVHPLLQCRCYKYRMPPRQIETLREYARSSTNLYVALAIQRDQDIRSADLYGFPPSERFEWLAVDIKQQLESPNFDRSAIYFPVHNQLNLATFSLLWGAKWVQNFFAPLRSTAVLQLPDLSATIPRIFTNSGRLDDRLIQDWNFLLRDMPKYRPELDDDLFKQINFRLGLGNALGIIRSEISAAAGRLDQIRNYCPEALYGTTNLWLFARTYRQFMETTADVGQATQNFVNQRLLPLSHDDPEEVPRILRCALWHVAIVYTLLGTEVRIVMKPQQHAGDDHSHYGGGIGYFPWISLTPDQAYWMIENDTSTASGDHIDFLNTHEQNVYMTVPTSLSQIARLIGIDMDQLRLPARAPVHLFPPESIFLRYPHELFGIGRFRALGLANSNPRL